MIERTAILATALPAIFVATIASAQSPIARQLVMPSQATVTVTGAASTSVSTDRLQAWLRVESENADPTVAANAVNAAMAKALARVKAVSAIKATTAGYSTQQVTDKGKVTRWRVSQSLTLDSGDFAKIAALVGKLQDEDGLLASGMSFSLSDDARRRAEESLTQEAIRAWQDHAQRAAEALGFKQWRPGHVTVQSGDGGRVPVMRAQASMLSSAAPVALEPGSVEVSVTVTGDAVLVGEAPAQR